MSLLFKFVKTVFSCGLSCTNDDFLIKGIIKCFPHIFSVKLNALLWVFEHLNRSTVTGSHNLLCSIYILCQHQQNALQSPSWVICLVVWGSSGDSAALRACAPCWKGFCCHSVSPDCKCKREHSLTKTLIQTVSTKASYVEVNCLRFYRHTICKMVYSFKLCLYKSRLKQLYVFKASGKAASMQLLLLLLLSLSSLSLSWGLYAHEVCGLSFIIIINYLGCKHLA